MNAARETVIVVHGTWSAPKGDDATPEPARHEPPWYAPGESFCRNLDRELEKRQSGARCWAHLDTPDQYFHWDGANDWRSRYLATTRLREDIQRLKADGWVVHLVGHSHGGNVILDATTDGDGDAKPWFNGRAVLYGTPVYRDASTYDHRQRRWRLVWFLFALVIWGGWMAFTTRDFNPLAAFADGTRTQNVALFVGLGIAILIAVLVPSVLRGVRAFGRGDGYRWSPAFLAINSTFDEAYRALVELPQGENPLLQSDDGRENSRKKKPTKIDGVRQVFASIVDSLTVRIRSSLGRSALGSIGVVAAGLLAIAAAWRPLATSAGSRPLSEPALSLWLLAIAFVILLFAVFARRLVGHSLLVPGIVVANVLPAVASAAKGVFLVFADSALKRFAWGILTSFGLGISGAPRRAEDIDVQLEVGGDNVYLELPQTIVDEVVARQDKQLCKVRDILYHVDVRWTPGELRRRLEDVDFPMVHTEYYRNATCVAKTADWIANPVLEFYDGETDAEVTTTLGSSNGQSWGIRERQRMANRYRLHVARLRLRMEDPGSPWRDRLTDEELRRLSVECLSTEGTREALDRIIHAPFPKFGGRVPHPPARER